MEMKLVGYKKENLLWNKGTGSGYKKLHREPIRIFLNSDISKESNTDKEFVILDDIKMPVGHFMSYVICPNLLNPLFKHLLGLGTESIYSDIHVSPVEKDGKIQSVKISIETIDDYSKDNNIVEWENVVHGDKSIQDSYKFNIYKGNSYIHNIFLEKTKAYSNTSYIDEDNEMHTIHKEIKYSDDDEIIETFMKRIREYDGLMELKKKRRKNYEKYRSSYRI